MKKVKKVFLGISTLFVTLCNHVFALGEDIQELYGPPGGIQSVNQGTTLATIGKFVILPIAIVGIIITGIVILVKSNKKKK